MNEIETKDTLASQQFWYVVFIIVYSIVLVGIIRCYGSSTMKVLFDITPFHLLILVLATFRITRLVVADRITQWVRDLCFIVSVGTDRDSGAPYIVRTKRVKGIRRVIGDIIGCPWCTGMWVALFAVVLYTEAIANSSVVSWVLIVLFAIAGGASIVQTIISLLQPSSEPSHHPKSNICIECGK